MKIVKYEKILLSESELDIWNQFDELLDNMLRDSNNSKTIELIQEVQNSMFELVNYVGEEEN